MSLPAKALLALQPHRLMRIKLFIDRNGGPILFPSSGKVDSDWLRKNLNPPLRIDAIWIDQPSA
jgi:hypothetical protein